MRANKQAQSGNEIVLTFDGNVLGVIQSLRVSSSFAPQPVVGIGSIDPIEYVPTLSKNTVQVSSAALRNSTLRKLGIMPASSEDALKGLVFDILIIDKPTKAVLRKIESCSFDNASIDIRANAVVMTDASFNALSISGDQL